MSKNPEIHVGDVGTVFEVSVVDEDCLPVDLSSSTVLSLRLKAGKAVTIERDAIVVNDGTDGKIKYTTVAGDLSAAGIWKIQAYVETPEGKWSTDIGSFEVHTNL